MIYIAGDTHGEIDLEKIENYFSHEYSTEKDILFILGDGGFVWDNDATSIYKLSLSTFATIIYLDGNHENFDLLNEFPVIEKFGAKMHKIDNRLFHVLRGEIVTVNNLKFFCLGGATSVDKEYRKPHISWWPEENISIQDFDNALSNLEKNNFEVDYVLTHCGPSSIIKKHFFFSADCNTDILEQLKNRINYKKWFFGHYHFDRVVNNKFRCFYNKILRIDSLYEGKKNATANKYYSDNEFSFLSNFSTGRKTKITYFDLPETYFRNYSYHFMYYKISHVVDVAYSLPYFSNHINKDATIYLSYDKKLPHKSNYEPVNKKDWDVSTWRVYLVYFINALSKYNPKLNLHYLKRLVNLTYDQYINDTSRFDNDLIMHPYPLEKPIFYKGSRYYVKQGKFVFGVFVDLKDAERMVALIIEKNFSSKAKRIDLTGNNVVEYMIHGGIEPNLYIVPINPKDIDNRYVITRTKYEKH